MYMCICRHIQVHSKGHTFFSNHWDKVREKKYSLRSPVYLPSNSSVFQPKMSEVLHLVQGNPKHKYWLCGEWIYSSPEEKDLGGG